MDLYQFVNALLGGNKGYSDGVCAQLRYHIVRDHFLDDEGDPEYAEKNRRNWSGARVFHCDACGGDKVSADFLCGNCGSSLRMSDLYWEEIISAWKFPDVRVGSKFIHIDVDHAKNYHEGSLLHSWEWAASHLAYELDCDELGWTLHHVCGPLPMRDEIIPFHGGPYDILDAYVFHQERLLCLFSLVDGLPDARQEVVQEAFFNKVGPRVEKVLIPSERVPTGVFSSGVYMLWSDNGSLLYVGQSRRILNRIVDHAKDKAKNFGSVTCVPAPKEDLDTLEGALINKFQPPLNKQSGRGRKTQYQKILKKYGVFR